MSKELWSFLVERASDGVSDLTLPFIEPSSSQSSAPTSGEGSRSAIRDAWDIFRDGNTLSRLESVAWIYVDAADKAKRFGEVLFCDTVANTNKQRRPLFDIATQDSDGNNIVFLEALLPNESCQLGDGCFLMLFLS